MSEEIAPAHAVSTRSRVVLEIASELAMSEWPRFQAKVLLREHGAREWPICLLGTSTIEGVDAVVKREADLAMINPAAALGLAYRGTGPFRTPLPVRAIGVIPSLDQYVFAVKSECGLSAFEDIATTRPALTVSLRGQADHSLHFMLDDIVAAAGFSLDDLRAWGGDVRREGFLPVPGGPKFAALARGEINAIFDEAASFWVEAAIAAGMTILPLAESTLQKLEAIGYRRSVLRKSEFPSLPRDVPTIDFSGWPIFDHADATEKLVTDLCAALDHRKAMIPWETGSLPVERMCCESPDTPQYVPLHPAAERYWRERGYLPS